VLAHLNGEEAAVARLAAALHTLPVRLLRNAVVLL
jgi:hypothetical protein